MTTIHLNGEDANEVIDIGGPLRLPTINLPSMNLPAMSGGILGCNLASDLIMNRKKVSADVISRSSASSSSGSRTPSEYTETETEGENNGGYNGRVKSEASSGSDDYDEDSGYENPNQRIAAEKSRIQSELDEKREIIYQLERLESRGFAIPRKFTLSNDIEEMRTEYHRLVREKEVDASVRFQRKMLVGFVTGIEFLNTKFDPFDMKLDGFSESIHENVRDYDDIFEELHDKYKATGKKMAPELRLMMSIGGSAFMFHLTNSMFKATPMPGVEAVLKNDPALMRQFQASAMNQTMSSGGGGLFGMIGNMFGMRPPMQQPPPQMSQNQSRQQQSYQQNGGHVVQNKMMGPSMDVEKLINQVHGEISLKPPPMQERFDTLSVSDEDITSLIDDEIAGVVKSTTSSNNGTNNRGTGSRSNRGSGKRTLNI